MYIQVNRVVVVSIKDADVQVTRGVVVDAASIEEAIEKTKIPDGILINISATPLPPSGPSLDTIVEALNKTNPTEGTTVNFNAGIRPPQAVIPKPKVARR